MRKLAITSLIAVAVGVSLGAPAAGQAPADSDDRGRLGATTTIRGLSDEATLVASCGTASGGGAFCGQNPDPKLHGWLPALGGDRVAFRLRAGARKVRFEPLRQRHGQIVERTHSLERAEPVAGSDRRRWRFELPPDLENANTLSVHVDYRPFPRTSSGSEIDRAVYWSRLDRRD